MIKQKRPAVIEDGVAYIPLKKDAEQGYAIVDIEYSFLADNHLWYLNAQGYPMSRIDGKLTRLHRLVLQPHEGLYIDHINGDKKDARKSNLRIVTIKQNNYNSSKSKNNTSGYKGVYKVNNKWRAQICGTVSVHGGYFNTKEEAAKAYNKIALEHFGKYARLNEVV